MGTELQIHVDIEGKLQEIAPGVDPATLKHAMIKAIGALPGGMSGGKPSLSIIIETDDGRHILAETSMKNFQMACAMFISEYGDVTDGDWKIEVGPDGMSVVG